MKIRKKQLVSVGKIYGGTLGFLVACELLVYGVAPYRMYYLESYNPTFVAFYMAWFGVSGHVAYLLEKPIKWTCYILHVVIMLACVVFLAIECADIMPVVMLVALFGHSIVELVKRGQS